MFVFLVVAFSGEEREVERYASALDDSRIQLWKTIAITQAHMGLIQIYAAMFAPCAWYAGKYLVPNNTDQWLFDEPFDATTWMIAVFLLNFVAGDLKTQKRRTSTKHIIIYTRK